MAKTQKESLFLELLRTHFRNYCEKSTIHCVRYLYDPHLHNVERLIWSVLLIISITLCCIFYVLLSERYEARNLETVVEDAQYPVFYLRFPAVAVCTDNRINWSKLDEAKAIFLPRNFSKDLADIFTQFVTAMETFRFGDFDYSVTELEDLNLEALDFVNITELGEFMSLRCEDIVIPTSCLWRRAAFNCCDYFALEKTELGFCLVYNSELSTEAKEIQIREGEAYYPHHNSKAGQGTGLNFDLLLDDRFKRPNSTITDNVFVMIKKYNQLSHSVYSMTPNTETYITVRPEITNTDEITRNLPPVRRSCLFPNEHENFGTSDAHLRFSDEFLLTNCLNLCHESYLVKLCNCSLPIFFLINNKVKNCNAASLRCLLRHNDIFSYDKRLEEDAFFSATKPGMTCNCMVSCNLIEYFTATTTLPLSTSILPMGPEKKLFKVDVHYQIDVVLKYRTSLEFSSIDLIANLGGIFGLCLGASMVSAVELIYYLTIGFALHLYDNSYYGVLLNQIKLKWRKWLRYLRNDVPPDVRHSEQQLNVATQRKLRHPLNHQSQSQSQSQSQAW